MADIIDGRAVARTLDEQTKAQVAAMVAGYAVVTALYSLLLKRLVIIDVMTIAALFILRVVAGAVAVGATASEYLLVCTAMLALFLGFTKRRQEAMLEAQPVDEPDPSRRRDLGIGVCVPVPEAQRSVGGQATCQLLVAARLREVVAHEWMHLPLLSGCPVASSMGESAPAMTGR